MTLFLVGFSTPGTVLATTFNPNLILTDEELTDYKSMGSEQIKNFLINKGGVLGTYADRTVRMYAYQLVYNVSRLYQINPKYILTLLQKEQSLVTDPDPTQGQLDWATGYGCPDSGGCNEKYRGLANQIDWGAGAMRYYLDHSGEFKYQVGQTYEIDGLAVTIANDATRGLYIYTPHIHGNKNLHTLWNNWFAMSYPDGALLQSTVDGAIWLIQNGVRRPFASKSAFASRYSFDKLIPVKPDELEQYEIGTAIKYSNYSLLKNPAGIIYLLEDDTLRPIDSWEVFRLIGFNPEEVVEVEEADILEYAKGESITVESTYPTGALIQDNSTGGVYYVKDGIKQPIWSKSLMTLYYGNKKLTAVSPDELTKYVTGDPVKLKDGELVKAPEDSRVFVISNGLKRPIATAEVFETLGYKWSNIVEVPVKVLNLHSEGEEVNINLDVS